MYTERTPPCYPRAVLYRDRPGGDADEAQCAGRDRHQQHQVDEDGAAVLRSAHGGVLGALQPMRARLALLHAHEQGQATRGIWRIQIQV